MGEKFVKLGLKIIRKLTCTSNLNILKNDVEINGLATVCILLTSQCIAVNLKRIL